MLHDGSGRMIAIGTCPWVNFHGSTTVGVSFFGKIQGFEPHYGFSTFGLAINSLFRVCTRISWEDIMNKVGDPPLPHWRALHPVVEPEAHAEGGHRCATRSSFLTT
jgi:hypothetical protein